MRIKVFGLKLLGNESDDSFMKIFNRLPSAIQERIRKYKIPGARNLKIVGKGLLLKALEDWSITTDQTLANLKYTATQQPYIDGLNLNFSISHSDDLVVCAIANGAKIGVDIEKIKPVKLSLMKSYIDDNTWQKIVNAPDPDNMFFNQWTIREAAVKASGWGLEQIELSEIHIGDANIRLRNETFYYKMLPLSHTHASCLACNDEMSDIEIIRLSLEDLL
jgi:4'-phosphopantetheinyl transferase